VSEPSHAVFLSYASQDAEAAQRICEALRTAGIEVWFDQSELRGGDAWDRQIRKEILSSSTIPRNDTQAFRRNSTRCSGRTCRQGRRRPLLPIADGISSPWPTGVGRPQPIAA